MAELKVADGYLALLGEGVRRQIMRLLVTDAERGQGPGSSPPVLPTCALSLWEILEFTR